MQTGDAVGSRQAATRPRHDTVRNNTAPPGSAAGGAAGFRRSGTGHEPQPPRTDRRTRPNRQDLPPPPG